MGITAPAALAGFGGILVFKEIADFIQIGLVAYQTGKRFGGSRGFSGGTASIDGATVRVMIGDASFALPIEDAASLAGVPGAVGGAKKPSPSLIAEVTAAQARVLPGGGAVGRWLESHGFMRNPTSADARTTVSDVADADRRPFSLREYALMQNLAIQRGQERKIQGERELEVVRGQFAERIAAARTDVERERLRGELAVRERELEAKILLTREEFAAEAAAQQRLFAQQARLLGREQQFKSVEAERDRQWRERTANAAAEIADYRKNLAADLALTRSLDAARKIKDIVGESARASAIGGFAGRFAP